MSYILYNNIFVYVIDLEHLSVMLDLSCSYRALRARKSSMYVCIYIYIYICFVMGILNVLYI